MVITFQTQEPDGAVAKLEAEAGSTFISLTHVLAMHDLRRTAVGGSSLFLRQEGPEMHQSPMGLDNCDEFPLSNRGANTLSSGSVVSTFPGIVDTLERGCRSQIVGSVVQRVPVLMIDDRRYGLKVDVIADCKNHSVGHHLPSADDDDDSFFPGVNDARLATFVPGINNLGVGFAPEMVSRPRLPEKAASLHVQMETLHEEREGDVGVGHSASESAHFTILGDIVNAVVLRLSSELPRLRVYGVRSVLNEGGSEDGSR